MLLEPSLEQLFDQLTIVGRHPAALDQDVGKQSVLANGPGGASLGELASVDQFTLEGQHPKQQVPVGVDVGHGGPPVIQFQASRRIPA